VKLISRVKEIRLANGIKYRDIIWAMSSTTICNAQKDEGIANTSLRTLLRLANLLKCDIKDMYEVDGTDIKEKGYTDMEKEESALKSEISVPGSVIE